MRINVKVMAKAVIAAAVIPAFIWSDRARGAKESREAQAFVEEFYGWYANLAVSSSTADLWARVANERPTVLDSTFRRVLQSASGASKSRSSDAGSIGWDPFLVTEYACAPYSADSVDVVRAQFRVHVSGQCGSNETESRGFDVVLDNQRRHWVIVTVQNTTFEALASMKKLYEDRD